VKTLRQRVSRIESLLFSLLLVLVVFAAVPLGSNQAWSWTFASFMVTAVATLFLLTRLLARKPLFLGLNAIIPLLFLLAMAWAWLQTVSWVPQVWHHPAWLLASETLGEQLPGSIAIAPEDTRVAIMRTLAYGLVFVLALQLGRDRKLASRGLRWLFIAGAVFSLYGLLSYFGVLREFLWYADDSYGRDVRATFVNRNHFATWSGLTLICGLGVFFDRVFQIPNYPMLAMQGRQDQINRFLAHAWLPLAGLILIVSALVSSHSRGGFAASLVGCVVLLVLIDRKRQQVSNRVRIIIATVLLVSTLAFWINSDILLQRYGVTGMDAPGRTLVYSKVLEAIADNPLLGYGHGNFEDAFRLYRTEEISKLVNYAHNSYLESFFDLGIPAALCLVFAMAGLALTSLKGVWIRQRDWVIPAVGVSASVLVGVHAMVDFSLQIPAVAMLYACIMGLACGQSFSSQQRHHSQDRPHTK
jgi:O-antigen ligase